jgi:hypothetical protein
MRAEGGTKPQQACSAVEKTAPAAGCGAASLRLRAPLRTRALGAGLVHDAVDDVALLAGEVVLGVGGGGEVGRA